MGKDKGLVLWQAAESGKLAAVRKLLKAGTATTWTHNASGSTALHAACHGGHVEVARALVEAGADVDAQDFDANTPLVLAAKTNCVALAELLLLHCSDTGVRSASGLTAREWALRKGNEEVAEMLLVARREAVGSDSSEVSQVTARLATTGYFHYAAQLQDHGLASLDDSRGLTEDALVGMGVDAGDAQLVLRALGVEANPSDSESESPQSQAPSTQSSKRVSLAKRMSRALRRTSLSTPSASA